MLNTAQKHPSALRVAIYQGVGPYKSIDIQVRTIKKILQDADSDNIDIVCFPECFLTGYFSEKHDAEKNSLRLSSSYFSDLLSEVSNFNVSFLIGFNEYNEGQLYNSVAVIEKGVILGIQRKHFLYHDYFTQGTDFIPINVKGVKIGVLICLDSNYLEPARILALQGTKIFFVPMCNQVPLAHPFSQKPEYYSHFIARSFENNSWLFASDWYFPSNGHTICRGHTCIHDPNGKEISRSAEGEQLLVTEVSYDHLNTKPKRRITGSKALNSHLSRLLCETDSLLHQGVGI